MAETPHAAAEFKARLRRDLLAARAGLDGPERSRRDAAIAVNLQAWLRDNPVAILGVYWPIRSEPDLRESLAQMVSEGLQLALPVMSGTGAPLRFAAWTPGDAVTFDRWGIATPTVIRPLQPDAVLAPCVGFDAAGFRIGYGGGFYDRTLAQLPRPRAIGIAYDNARCSFPVAAHDIAMDVMITDVMITESAPVAS